MGVPQPIIDVEELEQKLSLEQLNISKWVSQQTASAEAVCDEHDKMLKENEHLILNLAAQQLELDKQCELNRQRLAEEAAVVEALQKELLQSQQEAEPLPEAVQTLQQELREDLCRLQKRTAALELKLGTKRQSLDVLREEILQYQTNLGLSLESPPDDEDQLRVVFTQINPSKPEEEYSFNICSHPNEWEVTRCQPPVADLEQYVQQLNVNPKGFSEFVRSMRRAFKQLGAAS